MKNVIKTLVLGLFIIFVSCNSYSNLETQANSEKQANDFVSGNTDSSEGYNYTTIELTEFNTKGQTLGYANIFEAFRILNMNSDSPEVGFEECMRLISSLANENPDAQARIDIQYITYLLIDKNVVKLEFDAAQSCALLLNTVLASSEPVEWRPLAKVFEIAVPNLEVEEKNKIKNYLINGMSRTVNNELPILETSRERLIEDAKNNIDLVRAL